MTSKAERVGSCMRSCCASKSSVLLPLNSNPFLIFLAMTTSGHATRILAFTLSSANGSKESSVAREYTYEGVAGGNVLVGDDGEDELLSARLWMGTYNPGDEGEAKITTLGADIFS